MVCHNCKDFFKFRKIVSLFPLFVSPFWAKKFIYTHYKAIRHIENSKVAEITPLLSIITSNVNGLNFPIKIKRLKNWFKKTLSNYMISMRHTLSPTTHIAWK